MRIQPTLLGLILSLWSGSVSSRLKHPVHIHLSVTDGSRMKLFHQTGVQQPGGHLLLWTDRRTESGGRRGRWMEGWMDKASQNSLRFLFRYCGPVSSRPPGLQTSRERLPCSSPLPGWRSSAWVDPLGDQPEIIQESP